MSEFTTEGKEAFPSLYEDDKRVGEFSDWAREILNERFTEYTAFNAREDTMPRARATASRILNHIVFELSYREGFYE